MGMCLELHYGLQAKFYNYSIIKILFVFSFRNVCINNEDINLDLIYR